MIRRKSLVIGGIALTALAIWWFAKNRGSGGIKLAEGQNTIVWSWNTISTDEQLAETENYLNAIWHATESSWETYSPTSPENTLLCLERGATYIFIVFKDCMMRVESSRIVFI